MGVPDPGLQAAEQTGADTLLAALRTIKPAERARHETVLDYWLSIRGDKEFPPLHDLDPLQISEAGPSSLLLELIGGGQDAEIRHLGEWLQDEVSVQRIIDAPNPSILASIAKKLPIVAISRDHLSFEDSFDGPEGWTRLWVTLLPLSSCGSWVDYVYAFVSVERGGSKVARPPKAAGPVESPAEEISVIADAPDELAGTTEAEEVEAIEPAPEPEPVETVDKPEPVEAAVEAEPVETAGEPEPESIEAIDRPETPSEPELAATDEMVDEVQAKSGPGFSKLLEGFASLTGFYGQGIRVEDPIVQAELPPAESAAIDPPAEIAEVVGTEPEEALSEEHAPEDLEPEDTDPDAMVPNGPQNAEADPAPQPPAPAMEGSLQDKLTQVRARADEARQARLRAVAALHEGLSAAYDFALDAETSPEEYLRLVEAQGLKIQLRSPMAPVARLAFGDSCDTATLAQLEKALAWALKEELPRGALLDKIEEAGGLAELLNGK